MAFVSVTSILIALLSFPFVSIAQIPDGLPIDDATRQYLESLPPEKLSAILEIYQRAITGQVPASPEVIEAQELYWSYDRSPPFYPTREWSFVYDCMVSPLASLLIWLCVQRRPQA
jgi:beta-glucosidase